MVLLVIVFSLMLGSSTFTSLLAPAAASMLLSRSIGDNRSFIIIERDAGGGYDDLTLVTVDEWAEMKEN